MLIFQKVKYIMHNIHFPMTICGGEVHKLQGVVYLTILEKSLNNALKNRARDIMAQRIKFRSEIRDSGMKQVAAKEAKMANMLIVSFTGSPSIRHSPTQNHFDVKSFTF